MVLPETAPVEIDVIAVPLVCAPPVRQLVEPDELPELLLLLDDEELLVTPELLDDEELLLAPELPDDEELLLASGSCSTSSSYSRPSC